MSSVTADARESDVRWTNMVFTSGGGAGRTSRQTGGEGKKRIEAYGLSSWVGGLVIEDLENRSGAEN